MNQGQAVTSQLVTHLVDAADVEVQVSFDARLVEIVARDDNTLARYRLSFDRCESVEISYADEDDFSPYDLTDGVKEEDSAQPGVRRFAIHFADDSVIKIACRDFWMAPIEG